MAARWQAVFLSALRDTGNVRAACSAAGIQRSSAYRARERDHRFRKRWEEAMEEAADVLEAEARRRAIRGVEVPILYKGIRVDTTVRYSDALLMFLLKGARPGIYRDGQPQTTSESKPAIVELVERLRGERGKR